MAAQCYATGRLEDALGYAEAGQLAIDSGRFDQVPYEAEASLGVAYLTKGQPERWAELCRNMIARNPGTHTYARSNLVLALTMDSAGDEARAAAEGLLAAADTTDNPIVVCFACLAYVVAYRDADPVAGYEVNRRALRVAQDSGNRWVESQLAGALAGLAASRGDPMDAFDFLTVAIRNHYDSGSFTLMRTSLGVLAAFFDRLGQFEPAATIGGFAANPFTRTTVPEIDTAIAHLRGVLGDEAYQSLAHAGENMTNAAMATYAFDQIDRARAELLTVDESR